MADVVYVAELLSLGDLDHGNPQRGGFKTGQSERREYIQKVIDPTIGGADVDEDTSYNELYEFKHGVRRYDCDTWLQQVPLNGVIYAIRNAFNGRSKPIPYTESAHVAHIITEKVGRSMRAAIEAFHGNCIDVKFQIQVHIRTMTSTDQRPAGVTIFYLPFQKVGDALRPSYLKINLSQPKQAALDEMNVRLDQIMQGLGEIENKELPGGSDSVYKDA